MVNKRNFLALLLVAVMVMFTACGATSSPSDNPGSSSTVTGSSSASGSSSDTSSQGKTSFKGQNLTVLYMSSVYADAARLMVPEFEAATGAKVTVVDFPYGTLHEKALLDLTSGTASYDVIDVASQWDGEFAPYLTSLDSFIKKDNYDMTDWIDNVLANSGKWQGTIMGIPNASTPQVFAYRTDILPKGLPTTWEEYRKVLKENTDSSKKMYGVSIAGAPGQLGGVFDYVLWSMGGAWADQNWKPTLNSPESKAALLHLKEVTQYADPAMLSWGVEESVKAFLDGKAAVCETWPSLGITQNGDNPEKSKIVGKWALGVIPKEKTGVTLLSAWDMSISDASKNKELAWEWVKAYTSAEKQNEFYKKFVIFSPRKSFWEQPELKNSPLAPLRTALDTANIWWRIPASVEVDSMLNTVVSGYLSNQMTVDKALTQMEDGVSTALKNTPPADGVKNNNR